MEAWFLYAGMALCLFALWAIARHDWVRLTTMSRQADGEVIGHRISRDSDGTSYAATYRFSAEGKVHEVVDPVLSPRPIPDEGTKVSLTYPVGRPELARVSRPLLWGGIYLLLIGLFAVLFAKLLGWLPG